MASSPSSEPSPHRLTHHDSVGSQNGIDILLFKDDHLILSKIFLLETMIGTAFDELVFEGQFWVTSEFIVVLLLRVAADNVVWFLLTLINFEALKTKSSLGREVYTTHVALHSSKIRRHSDAICCLAN